MTYSLEKIFIKFILGFLILTNACVTEMPVPTRTGAPVTVAQNQTQKPTSTTVIKSEKNTAPSPTGTAVISSTPPIPTETDIKTSELFNPLTGLEVEDPDLLDRRPIVVKVQLFPRGQRPPWGISNADIVFDYYQNNGVTRLTAVFYGSDASQVGPIRSARLFDLDIIKMYKAYFVFGLADWRIYYRLKSSAFSERLVVEQYASCPPLCRVDPEGYNHLFLDTSALPEYFSDPQPSNDRQEIVPFNFSQLPPQDGSPAEKVYVRISHSAYNRWDFDQQTGKFLRFQDAREGTPLEEEFEPLIDGLNGEQITTDNLILLLLAHRYAYQTKAGVNEVFNIKFTGNGEARAFRDGQMYKLHWRREDSDAPLELFFPDGTPYTLKPGNTWFQLLGKSSSAQQIKDDEWRFEFKVP